MKKKFEVTKKDTAKVFGSGTLEVLATPRLVAMIENTACIDCQKELYTEETTVGVQCSIDHKKASRIGEFIEVEVTRTKTGKKSFYFSFSVLNNNQEEIACGHHIRVRVNEQSFMDKLFSQTK